MAALASAYLRLPKLFGLSAVSIPDLPGFLVCPPLGAGVARGGGCDGESVEARYPVVPFSSRPVGSYAHDPRVEERTHTSQRPEAA